MTRPRFHGTYYPPFSSEGQQVAVAYDGVDKLLLSPLAEGASGALPKEMELTSLVVSPRLGNTTRNLRSPSGALLETNENDVVDEIGLLVKQLGGSGSAALLYRLESSLPLLLGLLLFLAAFIFSAWNWGIPWAAHLAAHQLPDRIAYGVGDGALRLLDAQVFDASQLSKEKQAGISQRFQELAHTEPQLPLTLHFRKAGMPNAFALPNGSVVVTDELIELADHEEEVIAVMAHEMGHVHHRHGIRMAFEGAGIAALSFSLLGDLSQISTTLAALPSLIAGARFSQAHELEADNFSFEMLKKVGIAPDRFADILEKLEATSNLDSLPPSGSSEHDQGSAGSKTTGEVLEIFNYLSTHPATRERIKRFRKD